MWARPAAPQHSPRRSRLFETNGSCGCSLRRVVIEPFIELLPRRFQVFCREHGEGADDGLPAIFEAENAGRSWLPYLHSLVIGHELIRGEGGIGIDVFRHL